jgi:hypothetical protein
VAIIWLKLFEISQNVSRGNLKSATCQNFLFNKVPVEGWWEESLVPGSLDPDMSYILSLKESGDVHRNWDYLIIRKLCHHIYIKLLHHIYFHCRVDVKDLCQVKPPTGEESRFHLQHEATPGQRDLGILSLDKVAVLLQVSL